MKQQVNQVFHSLWNSARDLLPVILVIAFFQIFVLQKPIPNMGQLFVGTILVVIGLTLFVKGLETGLFPIGESMAYAFARKGSVFWLIAFAFSLGFGTTIAEPALIAVADKAAEVAAIGGVIENTESARASYSSGLRLTVALSVGLAIVVGVLRLLVAMRGLS